MAQVQEVDSLVHLKESRNLALLDRAEAIEGIQRGLISMERGEGHPAAEVFEDIRHRHNIPRKA